MAWHKQAVAKNPRPEGCGGEFVKSRKDLTGTIYYDNIQKRYAISVHIPGTYDSVDIGLICNIPDSLKHEGLSLKFDGDYYTFEGVASPSFAGLEYYNLVLTKTTVL